MSGSRRRIGIVGLASVIALVGGAVAFAGHQTAGVGSYTGCLKPNTGSLSRFAVGDAPSSPCPAGDQVVHVSGGDITSVDTPVGSGIQGGTTNGAVSLSLATVPAARAYSSVNVFVDNFDDEPGPQPVQFDAETFDTAGLHDTTTNTSRLTAPRAGIYVVTGNVMWCNDPVGFRQVTIVGGGGIAAQSRVDAATDEYHTSQSVSAILDLSAGAYVQLDLQQGSTGDVCTLGVTGGNPSLSMAWIGPD